VGRVSSPIVSGVYWNIRAHGFQSDLPCRGVCREVGETEIAMRANVDHARRPASF
jgi:hypothetical protein